MGFRRSFAERRTDGEFAARQQASGGQEALQGALVRRLVTVRQGDGGVLAS
jgi:hypothetical protein